MCTYSSISDKRCFVLCSTDMEVAICNTLFTRSSSDPILKVPVEKLKITRTPSHPSGRPGALDFYIPVIAMRNQAHAMFRPWKLMRLKDEKMSVHTKTAFTMYDPLRVVAGDFSRPPKRFYRTFWQSVARKLLRKYSF